jgi:hypothetical protein
VVAGADRVICGRGLDARQASGMPCGWRAAAEAGTGEAQEIGSWVEEAWRAVQAAGPVAVQKGKTGGNRDATPIGSCRGTATTAMWVAQVAGGTTPAGAINTEPEAQRNRRWC